MTTNRGVTKSVMEAIESGQLPEWFNVEDLVPQMPAEYSKASIRKALNRLVTTDFLQRGGTWKQPVFKRPTSQGAAETIAAMREAIRNADGALSKAEKLLKAIEEDK